MSQPSERTLRWFLGFVLALVMALGVPAGAGAAPFVYVTDTGANAVLQFRATQPDGALAPLSPASVPAGNEAFGLALAPSGAYAYTADGGVTAPSGSASQFSIAAESGLLSPLDPPSLPVDGVPSMIAVHPDGASAYIADLPTPAGGGGVYMFTIGAGGELTPKTPLRVTAGTFPASIALTPDGSSAYVTDNDGLVWQFDVDAGGVLHPKAQPSVPAGLDAFGIAVTPDGRSAFAANGDGTVSQYRIGVGGALMPLGTVPAGPQPNVMTISPDGSSAYVVNRGGSVSQYDIGSDGLVPKSPPTVPAGKSPFGIAVSGDGATVYVADQGDPSVIWQYAVDGDGGLRPLSPPSVPAGSQAGSVAVSPGQEPSNEFSFGELKKQKRKGKARLTLDLPGPGVVELTGKSVKRRKKHTAGDNERMSVAPKGKAKRRLRRRGSSKVKVVATYTPDGGTANEKSKKLRLVKR